MGWIRELHEGKQEQDAEQADEELAKLQVQLWLQVARARSLWSKLDKMALTEEARDAGDPMLAVVQRWEQEWERERGRGEDSGGWEATMDARIQGLYAVVDAWAVAWVDPAELRRQAQGIYLGDVYADEDEGWCEEWDGVKNEDADDEYDKENNMLVKEDACVKSNNMVVRKNSKKKADVAKEENGERLIK